MFTIANTVVIQIGNSDDKLKQWEWAEFHNMVGAVIEHYVESRLAEIHFAGASHGTESWQDAAWVITVVAGHGTVQDTIDALRRRLIEVRAQYRQESIAFTVGETTFI